MSECSIVIFMS